MKLSDTLTFPFRGNRPWANIGLLGVAQIIPVIGPILILGYGCLVEKILVRGNAAPAPTFDFHYFSKYLERGIMPFLVQLVMTIPLMIIIVPLVWAGSIGIVFISLNEVHNPVVITLYIVALFLFFLGLFVVTPVVILPFMLRASLLGNFAAAFDFRWVLGFYKLVGGTALVAVTLLQLVAIPILCAGTLLCYVGLFFSVGIVHLMMWHLQVKLYHLYLDRGGAPLVIVDEVLAPAFPVVLSPLPSPSISPPIQSE